MSHEQHKRYDSLWFTSAASDEGGLAGLFHCSFKKEIGKCVVDPPPTLFGADHRHSRYRYGLVPSNIVLNEVGDQIFMGNHIGYEFEILSAPLIVHSEDEEGGIQYQSSDWSSFFKIPLLHEGKGKLCRDYGTAPGYHDIIIQNFLIQNEEELLISWEGFYQDCSDPDVAQNDLVWTIGISKINPNCTRTKDDGEGVPVSTFVDCTSIVSIFYQGFFGKDQRLATGLATSLSPASSRRRMYYVSTIENRINGNGGGRGEAQIWIVPEGVIHNSYHPKKMKLPEAHSIQVSPYIAQNILDGGSIKLQLDSSGQPKGLCWTVYDEGIFCYNTTLYDDGANNNIQFEGDITFSLGSDKISESCTLHPSPYGADYMSSIATGLDVLWSEEEDGAPNLIVYGCYGQVPGQGNMTTVQKDGNQVQTIDEAFPGSILFGPKLFAGSQLENLNINEPSSDPFSIADDDNPPIVSESSQGFNGIEIIFLCGIIILGFAIIISLFWKIHQECFVTTSTSLGGTQGSSSSRAAENSNEDNNQQTTTISTNNEDPASAGKTLAIDNKANEDAPITEVGIITINDMPL